MTDLQAIESIAENFGNEVLELLKSEKRMNTELSLALEKMRWQSIRMIDEVRELSYLYGV